MPTRILTYCHDSVGLGHLRRSINVASALAAREQDVSVLCLTSSERPDLFALPPGVDFVRLPGIRKSGDGGYAARRLGIDPREITSLRAEMVKTVARSFWPDLILVDHAPLGVEGELLPMLEDQRARGSEVTTILGMRDILDEPMRARRELARPKIRYALDRLYRRIVIYGHPQVCDVALEYGLPSSVGRKIRYAGIACAAESTAAGDAPKPRGLVVTVGGGEDGLPLLEAVADWLHGDRGAARDTTVVTGPLMEREDRSLVGRRLEDAGAHVIAGTPDLPGLLESAEAVVGMSGYNTVYEALALRKRFVAVPRVRPRREQLERANRLAGMGLLSVLEPAVLQRPGAMARAVDRAYSARPVDPLDVGLRFDGAHVAAGMLLSDAPRQQLPSNLHVGGPR